MALRGEFNSLLAFVISNILWLPIFAKSHADAFSLITLFAFGSVLSHCTRSQETYALYLAQPLTRHMILGKSLRARFTHTDS